MKKYIGIFGIVFALILSLLPVNALAAKDKADKKDTEEEVPVKVESFVINSEKDSIYNATMKVSVDKKKAEKIDFRYNVAVVTDISQDGKEVANGRGTTGEDVEMDIDMSRINTYTEYRFKITIEYEIDGKEGLAHGYSMVFPFTQENYAEDFSGRDITVDVSGMVVDINWSNYRNGGDSVVLTVDVDGTVDFEEVLPMYDDHYSYFFKKDAGVITITLKQVRDGLVSKGLTQTIDLKAKDKNKFYLEFPEDNAQFDSVWNVKYFNAKNNIIKWNTDNNNYEKELNGSGSVVMDMEEDNKQLTVEYFDDDQVKWLYKFQTNAAVFAPTISMLEAYDGSKVDASKLTMVGKVDDTNATLSLDGKEITKSDNGSFSVDVELKDGKNVFEIVATNAIGKSSKATITIYREGGSDSIIEEGSVIKEYLPLIITLSVSIIMLILMFILTKKRGKKHEEQNN